MLVHNCHVDNCASRLNVSRITHSSPLLNHWFKVLIMAERKVSRRGDVFLTLLRFTLLAVVAAFLAVVARTLWNVVAAAGLWG